jgi:hypothetical protein
MEYGGGGGGLMPRPPLLTTLICDLISTWLGPTHLCFFPKEINKNSMLKEVETWGMFLQKLGLPDKRDITMYSRPFLRHCHAISPITRQLRNGYL